MKSQAIDSSKRVLVLAPHQDDEIDLAAYALLNLNGWDKYILYSTNGDNKTPAEVRYREAIEAARILGVPKDNILFLGYGDNQDASTCVFFSNHDPVVSASGHIETYGSNGIADYHFQKYGVHNTYNYQAYKSDLKEAILDIGPDLIICVDFDSHIDHRMLSLAFDEIMQEILSDPANLYHPEVWKRFGYTMSYFAPEDYTPRYNKENVFPTINSLKKDEFNLVGRSMYQWKSRIRIPAAGNSGLFICSHKIVQALKCHVSQYALFRAFRMDNQDEVFWRKRTDNIGLTASITVSSGDGTKLNDFKFYDTDEIQEASCSYKDSTWIPDDISPNVIFRWEREVSICSIVIYGSIYGNGYIGVLKTLCGEEQIEKMVTIDNEPIEIEFSSPQKTKELVLKFSNGFKNQNGIAEIEIFEHKSATSYADGIRLTNSYKNNSHILTLPDRLILCVDKGWLVFMRLNSYLLNYSGLLKSGGIKAVVNKIKTRL